MALLIKNNVRQSAAGPSRQGLALVDQWIQVSCPAKTVPATTTDQIFRVRGGRILVRALVGEVTTVIQAQADNLKVTSKRLDASSVAVGTAVDIASNVDINGIAVGALYFVEGDGTAGVLSTAGGALIGANSGNWIAPQGEIYLTTSATNTGAMKWDLYYMPLDAGAFAEGVVTATVAI